MKTGNRKLEKMPFAVSRSSRATLVAQVAGGLRSCIQSGFFKEGDVIPTTRDLAAMLGVSRIVTRAAVKSLTDAGLIVPRPRAGCVVLGRGEKLWRGNVLVVTRSDGRSYYPNVFTAVLRARLVKAGWLFTQVTAPQNGGKAGIDELEMHLTHPVTFAVSIFDNPPAERILSRSGVPFVSFGGDPESVANGGGCCIRYDSGAATARLAKAATRAGVKSVLYVRIADDDGDVPAALRAAGMDVDEWRMPLPRAGIMPSMVAFAARDAFMRIFSATKNTKDTKSVLATKNTKNTKPLTECLPDMIYFSDDFACVGALAAFAEMGIKVPDDVRVATLANRGNEPVYARDLCRLEMTPDADAAKFADALIARLEGRDAAFPATFGPTFVKGGTL